MSEIPENKVKPFIFHTRLSLTELTGYRASTLKELLALIKKVPDSSIYHHTHRYLQQHHYLSPEPPNDFAYWVSEVIGDDDLGERLASIDTVQFISINELRGKLVSTIETYLKGQGSHRGISVDGARVFHFMKSISFIMPTQHVVTDLKELADALKQVTIDSIYFHMFEAKLRLNRKTNDFSLWIEDNFGDKKLADAIGRFDPYTCTMDELRKTLIRIVEKGEGQMSCRA